MTVLVPEHKWCLSDSELQAFGQVVMRSGLFVAVSELLAKEKICSANWARMYAIHFKADNL